MSNRILSSARIPGITGGLAMLAVAAALALPLAVNAEPAEDTSGQESETSYNFV